ncbi:YhgE/Pip domain-containing protein [Nocardioides sp. zg-579]|uniref:YhgE/Pip domain-containing protein n=1 Tax=Nocardioides marmotae TaxID=2663857 RepID=A0A6I3JG49_9ACTN|nr:YhgE/Pip domain-containing protein [Nocardioides marmotae]MCR6033385.1 YhgE/Pip domain-containing protein [Gordonia jinghuaiqii]MTB97042.1 YhgE/Pip domain-containing protein [Nocardioides marmotae]QKE00705.1 YhgE/Pip domain-containing protein [Nocardioides marmotae]
MIAARVAATELRRLTSGTLRSAAVLALIVIPSLYSGLYLFANEDPYGRLGEVPAALVVEDQGARTAASAGEPARTVLYGDDVAKRLVDGDGGFGWVETTKADAEAGVRSGRFDSALVIGPEFSRDLVSPGRFEPRQASLRLITNDANNYMVATIAGQIVGEVRDSVAQEVGTEAATRFLSGFRLVHQDLRRGLKGVRRLSNGTGRLLEGLRTAERGTATLRAGAREAASGAGRLSSGVDRLAAGSSRLSSGAGRLSAGLGTLAGRTRSLPSQTNRLASGAREVAAGNREVASIGRDAASAARGLANRVDRAGRVLRRQLQALVADGVLTPGVAADLAAVLDLAGQPVRDAAAAVTGASRKLDRLSRGSGKVAAGATALARATPALVRGIGTARSGAARLASGAATARSGVATLASGARSLSAGNQRLANGSERLARGSVRLRRGGAKVDRGVDELTTQLRKGLKKIPDPDRRTAEATARTIGDPVRVADDQLASAGSYGAGLAPFFMSLAAWIGAYVLFLLVRPLSSRSLAAAAPAWQTVLGGWLPAAVIGLAQMAVMFLIVNVALDISAADALGTVGLLALASAAFVALLQAFNVWLGAVGQFLGLVLMLVQLVTAGGTFPWQTVPEPLQALHRILPMSYAVEGLRQTLYGGDAAVLARDLAVLLGAFVVGILATVYAAYRQRVWTPARLHPELVL